MAVTFQYQLLVNANELKDNLFTNKPSTSSLQRSCSMRVRMIPFCSALAIVWKLHREVLWFSCLFERVHCIGVHAYMQIEISSRDAVVLIPRFRNWILQASAGNKFMKWILSVSPVRVAIMKEEWDPPTNKTPTRLRSLAITHVSYLALLEGINNQSMQRI